MTASHTQQDDQNSTSSPVVAAVSVKDDWYRELKSTLVQQYIQDLQTLNLCIVQIVSKP